MTFVQAAAVVFQSVSWQTSTGHRDAVFQLFPAAAAAATAALLIRSATVVGTMLGSTQGHSPLPLGAYYTGSLYQPSFQDPIRFATRLRKKANGYFPHLGAPARYLFLMACVYFYVDRLSLQNFHSHRKIRLLRSV